MASVVGVRLPALTLPLPATAKDPDKRLFELAAVAGINDGVQAAVEVSEPKDNSEEGFRRPQSGVKRADGQREEEGQPAEDEHPDHDPQRLGGLLLSAKLEQFDG